MKVFSKAIAVLAASVLCLAFLGCKNSTNEDDGNSTSKLNAPTNLVINSMTDNKITCDVNITFSYNGETGLDGATKAVLDIRQQMILHRQFMMTTLIMPLLNPEQIHEP